MKFDKDEFLKDFKLLDDNGQRKFAQSISGDLKELDQVMSEYQRKLSQLKDAKLEEGLIDKIKNMPNS